MRRKGKYAILLWEGAEVMTREQAEEAFDRALDEHMGQSVALVRLVKLQRRRRVELVKTDDISPVGGTTTADPDQE